MIHNGKIIDNETTMYHANLWPKSRDKPEIKRERLINELNVTSPILRSLYDAVWSTESVDESIDVRKTLQIGMLYESF